MVRARAPLALIVCLALLAALLAGLRPAAAQAPAPVTLLTIDGAIGPASADYVERGIARAVREGSQLVILQLDTPGGLDTSMRTVIKAILTSPVPVAAYVAPGGARAASAGTYIVYASHIAAMAPGTNLGAATPVALGGGGLAPDPGKTAPPPRGKEGGADGQAGKDEGKDGAGGKSGGMAQKQLNDAAAYLRSLAQLRGRNAEWAERAVRESHSLPADEALKLGVIEHVAADVPALLAAINGKQLSVAGRVLTLRSAGAPLREARPDWRAQLLAAITDPSIALILMTLGLYGLLFEFMSPGAVVPGVVGALCLLLGLYGLQLLPLNYAGLALLLLGVGFMVAEAFLPSFGVLGLGGVAAFVSGALILIDTELPDYGIPLGLIVVLALVCALLMAATAAVALRTRRRQASSGPNALVGSVAEVLDEGWANVHGETWRVVSRVPLKPAQKVRVLGRQGALLEVAPLDQPPQGETP